MEDYKFWLSPLDYNYYLNDVPITKAIMDMRMEDRLSILQREISMLELQNKMEQQRYAITNNLLANSNIFYSRVAYDKPKEEPFIIIYKSKPIRGITLELWGKNPKYNW